MDSKYLGVIAASALIVLVAQPAHAVTIRTDTVDEVLRNHYLKAWDIYELDDESAKILSDKDKCPHKCKNARSEGGGGGGNSSAFGAGLASGQSLAAALLGGAGSGGGSSSGKQFNSALSSDENFDSGSSLQQFDPGHSPSVSAAPLPAALPLFASGLGAMGLLGWWRKRKKDQAVLRTPI